MRGFFGSKDNNGSMGVVSLSEREKELRMAPLKDMETYWHGLRAGEDVPLRSQIDPRGLEGLLEYAFLGERIARGMAKLRVSGTHLGELMGMDLAGMPLSTFIQPADRERFAEGVEQLFAGPSILRCDLIAETGFGKPDLSARLVMLPLRSDMGDVSRTLGALISQGRIGRTPRRFALTEMEVVPLSEAKLPTAPAKPLAKAPTPAPRAFAESQTPYKAPETKKNFLRLIVDNDKD